MTAAPDPAPAGADAGLDQLRRGEFGTRPELVARAVVIVAAGMALYLYKGWWIGLAWTLAYLLSQAVAWVLLHRPPPHGARLVRAGYASYVATTAIYTALPLGLLLSGDTTLVYCGAMGLIALGVFTLWREEAPAALLPFDVALGWLAAGTAFAGTLRWTGSVIEVVILAALSVTAAGYYTLAMIANRRTRQALKAAAARGTEAQKMEAIGRLSGGIAHDFNNILTVLQGNLELYEEIADPEERRRLVQEAHAAALRASGLVAQLLAFARRAPLAPAPLDAGRVMEDLAGMAARVLPESIRVTHVRPAGVLPVRADPDRLLAALLNLVINARDAMAGRGRLTLSAGVARIGARDEAALPPGDYVRFVVGDTGPGMDAATAARALEPFYTTKPVGAGSGLGLPMAKGFAEQSGGALRFATADTGTTVSILLPLAPAAGGPAGGA